MSVGLSKDQVERILREQVKDIANIRANHTEDLIRAVAEVITRNNEQLKKDLRTQDGVGDQG